MNPDKQIELYRAARSVAWSYRLDQYDAAALKDMQRVVEKSKGSIVQKFADGLGREGPYTRQHYQNNLKELERLSLGLRHQLGEQLTVSASRIGSLALKEWGENLSVGGVAKIVNTVALSPDQFKAFFTRNPPAGILIPKVMRNALNQGVIQRIEGDLLDVLREGALTGQSYKRIVDGLEQAFTDFSRHQLSTLTRTFFQTANAQAFDAVYQANQDIMEGKIWTNVNDDRVCLLCLPLGEVLYKKGDPHPPMPRHPNCRCVFRAKTVSYRSLGIDLDELEEVAAPVVTRGYFVPTRGGANQSPAYVWKAGKMYEDDSFFENAELLGVEVKQERLPGMKWDHDYIVLPEDTVFYHATRIETEAAIYKEGIRMSSHKGNAGGVYMSSKNGIEEWHGKDKTAVIRITVPKGEKIYQDMQPNAVFINRDIPSSWLGTGRPVSSSQPGKWIIPPVGTGAGRGPRSISFYKGGMKEAFPDLPAAQQKAILGPGRYNMYAAGELTLDQLADPVTGRLWLLKELDEGLHLRVPDDVSKIVRKFDSGSFFQSSYIDELSNLSDSELREHPLWGRITRDIRDDDTYSDSTLAEILKIQGFDNLPTVVDTIVDSPGSLTMYRGVTGYKTADGIQVTAEDALEQFRSGKVFPGLGIYGNGTYAVYGDDAYRIASEYAGGNAAGIVKMQFKPGSKIISYDDLRALDTPDFAAKVSGVREIQDQMDLHRRNDEPPSGLSSDERSEWRSAWRKKEQELMKERDKRERIERYVSNIRDYGQKAALLGYDAIDCGTRNPYYVILNRSALRIEGL